MPSFSGPIIMRVPGFVVPPGAAPGQRGGRHRRILPRLGRGVPETPGELRAVKSVGGARLEWKTYGEPGPCEIQRSVDYGPRQALGRVEHGRQEFTDAARPAGHVSYRVRVLGKKGASPCSNPAWVEAP